MGQQSRAPLAPRFLRDRTLAAERDAIGLEVALSAAVARGQVAWRGVDLAGEVFADALGAAWDGTADPVEWLATVHVTDLYLACACVSGDVRALAILEEQLLVPLGRELSRSALLGGYADEAVQQLRVRLLLPDEGTRLSDYRGKSPLAAWLRLAMTRLALNVKRGQRRETTFDDEPIGSTRAFDDPELTFLRRTYAAELGHALRAALAATSVEDRGLLRMHFLDGLSAAQIGTTFRVSPRTIQRRIATAREQILAATREALRTRFGADATLLDNMIRLVGVDLHVSLQRLLAAPPGAGSG